MSEKLAVLMEFNGYTKDELEAYLSLKFGSMTKGGMTASILSQSGYEKAKSVIFGQPQLNENQQMILDELKINTDYHKFNKFQAVFWMLTNFINYPDTLLAKAYKELAQDELEQVFQVFSQWAMEQEAK